MGLCSDPPFFFFFLFFFPMCRTLCALTRTARLFDAALLASLAALLASTADPVGSISLVPSASAPGNAVTGILLASPWPSPGQHVPTP